MTFCNVKFKSISEYYNNKKTVVDDFLAQVLDRNTFFLEVAISEAVNNGLYHSFGEVELTLRLSKSKKLFIRVKDNGTGFDVKHHLHKLKNNTPVQDSELLKVSGRGIFLMDKFCDQVVYNKAGNEVLLVKRLVC